MYKGLYIFIIAFCVCFTPGKEGGFAGERANDLGIWSQGDPVELESNLIGLIQTQGYTYKRHTERQLEMYFDTPELILLKKNFCLKYEAKEYLSKKNNKKYHEKIEVHTENNKLIYPVTHYSRAKSTADKHPFMGMVKRKDRPAFVHELKSIDVKHPLKLKMIFNVSKIIRSYSIFDKNGQIGTIIMEIAESTVLKNKISFNRIRTDVNATTKKTSDPYLIYSKLEKFCGGSLIVNDNDANKGKNEYAIIVELMKKQVLFFYFQLKYPYIIQLVYSALTTMIGLLIIKVLFWNRFLTWKIEP